MSECIGYLDALQRAVPTVALPCNEKLELLGSEEVLVDGVQLRQTKYIVDDAEHRFDGLKPSDFFLENLLAAGVDLKQSFCRSSHFGAVEHLELELEKMSSFSSRVKSMDSGNVNS